MKRWNVCVPSYDFDFQLVRTVVADECCDTCPARREKLCTGVREPDRGQPVRAKLDQSWEGLNGWQVFWKLWRAGAPCTERTTMAIEMGENGEKTTIFWQNVILAKLAGV